MNNKIMGLLSTLFAFNFVVATPAIANEQRHGSKNNEPQNAQKFEHKPVQIVTQRHNHHHRNSSNYNNQYHHKNQHNVKLKTHRKQVGSFIEINTSHIPLLSIIVSKNKIINPQHHSVKHQKNRNKRQKLNQHKRKQDSHYGAVNYLAFDPHR